MEKVESLQRTLESEKLARMQAEELAAEKDALLKNAEVEITNLRIITSSRPDN